MLQINGVLFDVTFSKFYNIVADDKNLKNVLKKKCLVTLPT